MIGIYKITNPKGRIYIGQSINLEARQKIYARRGCKNQVRLYASLVKYGFSEHIFEIIEECKVEDLNIRERHWQDFYEVLGEGGLNCKLTGTDSKSGHYSEEAKKKISDSNTAFYQTPKGKESKARQVSNTDYAAFQERRVANTDYAAIVAKKDFKAIVAKVNYKANAAKVDYVAKAANTDFVARTANTDYIAKAKKYMKPILQYKKDGTFIKEWSSAKEAGESLQIRSSDITACCRGRQKTSGKFIWKYLIKKLDT